MQGEQLTRKCSCLFHLYNGKIVITNMHNKLLWTIALHVYDTVYYATNVFYDLQHPFEIKARPGSYVKWYILSDFIINCYTDSFARIALLWLLRIFKIIPLNEPFDKHATFCIFTSV